MWIVSTENERQMMGFLRAPCLWSATVIVDDDTYTRLNPQGASPFYIFIDDQHTLQASGFIGDDNWQQFVAQVGELHQARL